MALTESQWKQRLSVKAYIEVVAIANGCVWFSFRDDGGSDDLSDMAFVACFTDDDETVFDLLDAASSLMENMGFAWPLTDGKS